MIDNHEKYINMDPEALLNMLNMLEPPFNPRIVAEKIGIPISEDLDWLKLAYDGEIFVDDDKKVNIWINNTNQESRKRFTIAHEIGHFVYDVSPNIDTFDAIFDDEKSLSFKRDGDKNFNEYRANDFAARLLMPKEHVIKNGKHIIDDYFHENNEKISKELLIKKLSNIFEVSKESMKWRLVNLNLINI